MPASHAAARPPDEPVLAVEDLHFAHPDRPPLFEGLSFALPAGLSRLDGEIGKTTLLRLLAGDLQGRGRFRLDGAPWDPVAEPASVCWIDPRSPAWDPLTPADVAARMQQRHPVFDEGVFSRATEHFGLGEHAHKTMHMLSTGSRRKVALAAALAAGATLTLLDEPTAGLDRPSLDGLAEMLAEAAPRPRRAWLLAAAWGLEDRLPWQGALNLDV